jgi:hypothetical protein
MANIINLHPDHDPTIDIITDKIKDILEEHYGGEYTIAMVVGVLEVIKSDIIEGRW